MRRSRLIIVIGLAAGSLLVPLAVLYHGQAAAPTSATTADDLDKLRLLDNSFGEVWLSSDFKHTVRLQNDSDTFITVSDIKPSCRCTSVEPRSFDLAPHDSVALRLQIDFSDQLRLGVNSMMCQCAGNSAYACCNPNGSCICTGNNPSCGS